MAKKLLNIAIVGATGIVGAMELQILAERHFPVGHLHLLASARSVGKKINFRNKDYLVEDVNNFDFSGIDLAFFSAGSDVAAQYVPLAIQANCWVIDKSSLFRYDNNVALIVPEVNAADIKLATQRIIATPNCLTTQLVTVLKPIYDTAGIERINVCTYQSVSGAGQASVNTLRQQVKTYLAQPDQAVTSNKHVAFNVVPCIDSFVDNGYTKEEMKLVWEVQKIFHDENIKINPTAVRVPVFYGHSQAVHLETKEKMTAQKAKDLLRHAAGVQLIENNQDFPTALSHAAGTDPVYVGRVREDISHERGLNLWIVADNLRKGAALNAVQIAELLVKFL